MYRRTVFERFDRLAAGTSTRVEDGNDPDAIAIDKAIARAREVEDNVAPIAHLRAAAVIGCGSPNKAGQRRRHTAHRSAKMRWLLRAKRTLGWTQWDEPFYVPDDDRSRPHGEKIGSSATQRLNAAGMDAASKLSAAVALDAQTTRLKRQRAHARMSPASSSDGWDERSCRSSKPSDKAWRRGKASRQKVIERLLYGTPPASLIGGSADLTGSNGTRTGQHNDVKPGDFSGNYIHYGVREHGMAAAMNGMALHGGIVPYGGTFLVFTDYCRPAIRLSALMGQRVIYVMTHDSIGLGEDGPTHQPVEHLAALRAMPNLQVFRPADSVECAEAWELALANADAPSILALTRQGLPVLRTAHTDDNLSAKGAYVLREADGARDVTLLATGSEVGMACEAADLLAQDGIKAGVVSMPCWELFRAQPVEYRDSVLGAAPRVGVEAAVIAGWHEWLGGAGRFVGMDSFGASAPAGHLFKHFGITAQRVAHEARKAAGKG